MNQIFRGLLCLSILFLVTNSFAQDLSYPELQVTPKASDRLKSLSEDEKNQGLFFQLPFQISAASTLVAGLMQFGNVDESKDPDKKSPLAGVVIGGAWLGINCYLGQHYNIYQNTYNDITRVKGTSMRDQLTRERYAEEGMQAASRLAKKLKYMSVISNVAANVYMLSNVEKSSTSEVVNGVSLLAALGPLFFDTQWQQVWRDQQSYKKKIYGPVVSTGIFNVENLILPGVSLSLKF